MKKYLPLFLFLVGILAVIAAYSLVIKGKKKEPLEEETSLIEVPLAERPLASLTPSTDGHWLKMKVEKIVINAASLDYELLYKLPDGRTQGVPGTIELDGQKEIERDLLLGSESSGKFRYDEGVENGTLTLRFRNKKGKLVAKFSTDFHLQSDTSKLQTFDGAFTYTLSKTSKAYFVSMETFGAPKDIPEGVSNGPYGIFSSSKTDQAGNVGIGGTMIYRWTGSKWHALEDNNSSDIGIFIATSD